METVVGIEVHVELKSNSKVFSYALNDFNVEPNVNVNEVDLGYPGVLPRLNKKVIEMALQAALAFNCKINKVMHFDRKNYFYPDLPKGYQITQQDTPIGYDGYIEIEDNGIKKKIGIERIHIEEDAGLDCYCHEIKWQDDCQSYVIGLGFAIEIPKGYVGLLFPRSSARKHDYYVPNCIGVIDSGYRGEVQFTLKPRDLNSLKVKPYNVENKCCQLIIMPYPQIELEEVEELSKSERGIEGHGSTGK